MSSCEKCWSESGIHGSYFELIKRIPACTPEEQAGHKAGICSKCTRKTIHQYTGECMACKET
ncbi:hypothetical protein LCGC14_2959620 [marine sediment metagenome]|uniref:Uncharacterized protein n=1 Tax=marine sediment metagenome TaxID=412755 RepID=A0A0F8ZKH1_9ZZZZ